MSKQEKGNDQPKLYFNKFPVSFPVSFPDKVPVSLNQSKYSVEPKNFLSGLHPLNPLLRASDPPAPLTLTRLLFPLIMFPAGSYNIHPEHNKMASD